MGNNSKEEVKNVMV